MRRARMQKKDTTSLDRWRVSDSIELYGIDRWGQGSFTVNDDGHLTLVGADGARDIDLKELVDEVRLRGLEPPVLLRFTDILSRRLDQIASAFGDAIRESGYQGAYRGVYPIKVNQHRHVLEDVVAVGRKHHWGLECGSKPELVLAIALQADPDAVIVCNGFKDRDYIRTALFARRLGHKIFLVIEKLTELPLILDMARQMNVEPLIGIRLKLSSRGKGKWESSGGERSKFGLRSEEVVNAIRILRRRRMLGALQLLHWHLGSQISDIQSIKEALKEAAGFVCELSKMGVSVAYVDVGGGLAVDYDGSHTNFASSANYTIHEYASDVVWAIKDACDEQELPHPVIITEAGRSMVAHHSVLVLEPLGVNHVGRCELAPVPKRAPAVVKAMASVLEGFVGKNFQESFHDALEARRDALMLFSLRHLSLTDRATVERYFWSICSKIHEYISKLDYVPDEVAGLGPMLASTYYCNFSVFQSLPDHWAIKQLFPIVPLHRLGERPTEQAILADITCDSDGVINQFVDLRDVKRTLPLHVLDEGEPYYIGVFLVGAYQEILGDLHNLFGDTHVVHVSAGCDGYVIDKTVEGDSVAEVLNYVAFSRREVLGLVRERVEAALRCGAMRLAEAAPFVREIEEGMDQYTYFRRD